MEVLRNFKQKISNALGILLDRMGFSIRAKLLTIFLIVEIVPLIVLLVIAWSQFEKLGKDVQTQTSDLAGDMTVAVTEAGETAAADTTNTLIANAVEQIERITTDTANTIARFLYDRDDDIRYLASLGPNEAAYRSFLENKTGQITEQGKWDLADDGMSWVRIDIEETAAPDDVSTNDENNDEVNGASFNYRPADTLSVTSVPYYDEITFIGTDLKEKFKIVSDETTKVTYLPDPELKDISDPANTYVGAEQYGTEIANLEPGEIYVSDVIGAYVPSHFIGMYTPKQMVISAVNSEITALSALETQTDEIHSTIGQLTLLRDYNIPQIHLPGASIYQDEPALLMQNVADAAISLIDSSISAATSQDLLDRIDALKTKIANLVFDPYNEAFAGEENPLGKRFEGIVRWVTPVVQNDVIVGYVSVALNHDHIMEFTDHITPMSERYKELSSAFEGNYAFIWDYQCRSICHPRHHSIVGYDPDSGNEQIPWLESSIYESLLEKIDGTELSDLQENWNDLINDPQTPDPDYKGVDNLLPGVAVFDEQSRSKKPAAALTAAGLVGLDGRYLNNAPQCTGWMDLTREGGSGSFYILWSGLYKLTTAAAIPYYTGQYAPSEANDYSQRGFAMVTIGAGLEDFQRPADETAEQLLAAMDDANENIIMASDLTQDMITDNMEQTTVQLVATTAFIIIVVIFIAIWFASFIAGNVNVLILGLTRFRMGNRRFRFHTERKDEFGELADSFDDMANSIESSVTAPMTITDMNLNVIYMNDHGLAAVQRVGENVVGRSYKEVGLYPSKTEYCPITALHEGREAATYYNKRDGKYFKGEARYLLDKKGERIGYIIMSTDMTDVSLHRIRLEQAVDAANRANEHKGEFLARMSHEIRTPMNAILGITNIVEKKLNSINDPKMELGDVKNNVTQIENSSQHLLGLLNDILDLSKIEAGKIVITEDAVNISKLATTVQEIIQPRCDEKDIHFVVDIDKSLDSTDYMTDALRLRQVLINLLGNAVKFTPAQGTITFAIQKLSDEDGIATLKFSVEDTGIGISEESLSKVFEAFEQGDGGITRQYGGTGLGLPISRSIVKLLGGDIAVKSEVGKGSLFAFTLKLVATESAAETETVGDLGDVDFSDKCILIVDDVDINRMITSTLLEDTHIKIIEASNGQEAIDRFAASDEGAIDIILMDVMMPVVDGLEATITIRSMDREDAKTIPIIALTANAFKEDVSKAIDAGMNAHLAKPIDAENLIALLYLYLADPKRS